MAIKIKSYTLKLCKYCHATAKNLIKCSNPKCKIDLCSGCRTYINDKPFCNDCIAEMVRNDSLLIITKKELFK